MAWFLYDNGLRHERVKLYRWKLKSDAVMRSGLGAKYNTLQPF